MIVKCAKVLLAGLVLASLSGCNLIVLDPPGYIASEQAELLIITTLLMLIIVIPVLVATFVIAWRYRHTNKKAAYAPEWEHSTKIELLIWAVPLLIIIAIGAITWIGTHTLDPYRPVDRISEAQPLPADAKTLVVEVVSLDWKWLFIYPQYGIATVNQLAAPINTPIQFKITSSAVMNSMFIPALAGMIMNMAGMESQLHAVIDEPGNYLGFSGNYSGAGFSDMEFRFLAKKKADFSTWVHKVKASGQKLDRGNYLQLAEPSSDNPVTYYSAVDPTLYHAILNMCVKPGKLCMHQIMAINAAGGRPLEHEEGAAHAHAQ